MTMKKLLMALICMTVFSATTFADDDKQISADKLPAKAQEFIKQHFVGAVISYAKQDKDFIGKDYEVMLSNGCKIDFDKNGEWQDVDCKVSRVPDKIVPVKIQKYIEKKHGGAYVIEIDRDAKDYEVTLNNKMEIKFDKSGNFISFE